MDIECKFGMQYQPLPGGKTDVVLHQHLDNCEECQGQIMLVDASFGPLAA